MRDLQKAPASAKAKHYPILFEALLRSLGNPITSCNPRQLMLLLQTEWSMPMSVVDYNGTEWSNAWCNFATTKLPALKPFHCRKPICWEVPRPTTVITEFDHLPPSQKAYCYTDGRSFNKQLADGRRLWRLLLSVLTGNTLVERNLLNNVVATFVEELYSDIRCQYTHARSSHLAFNWSSKSREASPLIEADAPPSIASALASVWPGIAISTMAQPVFMGWSQAIQTSLNPFYSQRRVTDVARGMYGTTSLSRQISNNELALVVNFLLLTNLHEEVYNAVLTGLPASTGNIVQRTINQVQAFTRTVVNDYSASAGKLVAYYPKTFTLE